MLSKSNKNLVYILQFFVLILVLSACNQYEKTYYDDGKLKEKYQINKDKEKDGAYLRYHANGTLAEETNYQNGLQEGLRKIFTESGDLEFTSTYADGKLNGPRKVYFPTGKLRVDSNYKDDQLIGTFYKYYENGNLQEEVTFVEGAENGPFVEYYDNGVVKWKGNYLNGDNEFGLLEHFDVTGKLIKKMQCDSTRMCITIWKEDQEIKKG
ncbi:MAG TPA: toxin-antitoxin system YwqK family antitoxin [Saprospiraceae bacterium]|nr:toxin-antitoxin system YwqK family antitoxin [Saprospiraceae bacterium]HPN70560.1 toxin-antitoxin system YwqK family antitoxin [Saprospiraceae bacterium]